MDTRPPKQMPRPLPLIIGLGAAAALIWGVVSVSRQSPTANSPVAAAVKSSKQSIDSSALQQFHQTVEPILKDRCYDCHGDGEKRGGLALDALKTDDQILRNPELWFKVLRNTRAGIMPPKKKNHLSPEQQQALEKWIEVAAFGLDPQNPDPGRVTVRRLNRAEYRNTIRDLTGVDFDTESAFPSDDVGYGFDGIGDVQTISPMRMEKFIEAAQFIVNKAVPTVPRALSKQFAIGKDFHTADGAKDGNKMTFYQHREVSHTFKASAAGDYRIVISVNVDGVTQRDPQRCTVVVRSDGQEFFKNEYRWYDCEFFTHEKTIHWEPGDRQISLTLDPVEDLKQRTKMDFNILTVEVQGPLEPKYWVHPPNYDRFFSRDLPPEDPAQRRVYAHEVLTRFATKAFRRPAPSSIIDPLVGIAENAYSSPGTSFEAGVARAMVAVLASPRFLFRVETDTPAAPGQTFASVDEYALASRLSYFLWSSLPDDELFTLAGQGKLRQNLNAQVKRMFADPRAEAFVKNFSGQWLQSREVMGVPINRTEVMAREGVTTREQLTPVLREAMKEESEACFGYVARGDRSVLELLESDYTFVNDTLARFYGIPDVTGPEMRQVKLPPDSMRGGVLTMASVLAVTSNPTRTSPVKRGKWILENILGSPAPPPPPNIPALEDAEKKLQDRVPTQREVLAIHREDALCASCHARMDPLGLALENFNALGLWRTNELKQPVDATGQLISGESFQNIRDLKHILAVEHRMEYYRTLTEKLMTYALGRGLEYYDSPTVEKIARQLNQENGRFSALLMGVIDSAPFQKRRPLAHPANPGAKPVPLVTQNQDSARHENHLQ